jgi:hypothetical protein
MSNRRREAVGEEEEVVEVSRFPGSIKKPVKNLAYDAPSDWSSRVQPEAPRSMYPHNTQHSFHNNGLYAWSLSTESFNGAVESVGQLVEPACAFGLDSGRLRIRTE